MSHISKTHNRFISFIGLITLAVFGIFSLLGSGGGGGDGGGGGVQPVEYTGATGQALITSDNQGVNALLFGEVAFLGVTASTTVSVASVQSAPLPETRNASVITITRILHDTLKDIAVNATLSPLPVGWIETIPRVPGTCGGFVSGSLDVNNTTRAVSGYILFEDYCVGLTTDPADGITMDGRVEFTGTCDAGTFDVGTETCDLIDYVMTFTTFNARGFGESETMTGTMATVITPTGYESTLNLLLRDDNANVTYNFENYVITVTEDTPAFGTDSVVVVGKVYHPDYGYVNVTTPTPAQFDNDLDSPPKSGVVLLTGANGAAGGPTTARFTFFNTVNPTFTADVDEDGDTFADKTWNCDWDGNCT